MANGQRAIGQDHERAAGDWQVLRKSSRRLASIMNEQRVVGKYNERAAGDWHVSRMSTDGCSRPLSKDYERALSESTVRGLKEKLLAALRLAYSEKHACILHPVVCFSLTHAYA